MKLNPKYSNSLKPIRTRNSAGLSLVEIVACLFIVALVLPSLSSIQSNTGKSIVKAGEFMVATAVLHNLSEIYKIKPFNGIIDASMAFDAEGSETSAKGDFLIKIRVETVPMANNWVIYKRIYLEVEKPGILFGTTILKTVVIRSSWIREI